MVQELGKKWDLELPDNWLIVMLCEISAARLSGCGA